MKSKAGTSDPVHKFRMQSIYFRVPRLFRESAHSVAVVCCIPHTCTCSLVVAVLTCASVGGRNDADAFASRHLDALSNTSPASHVSFSLKTQAGKGVGIKIASKNGKHFVSAVKRLTHAALSGECSAHPRTHGRITHHRCCPVLYG